MGALDIHFCSHPPTDFSIYVLLELTRPAPPSCFAPLRRRARAGIKGIWLSRTSTSEPYLTLIGSSNFGNRSDSRDLECTLLIEQLRSDGLEAEVEMNAERVGSSALLEEDCEAEKGEGVTGEMDGIETTKGMQDEARMMENAKETKRETGPEKKQGEAVVEMRSARSFSKSLKMELRDLNMDATDLVTEELFERQERRVHWGVRWTTRLIRRLL